MDSPNTNKVQVDQGKVAVAAYREALRTSANTRLTVERIERVRTKRHRRERVTTVSRSCCLSLEVIAGLEQPHRCTGDWGLYVVNRELHHARYRTRRLQFNQHRQALLGNQASRRVS